MRSAAFLTAYGVVTFLSFPQPLGNGVLDLGMVLAWLSPALLIMAVDGLSPKQALKRVFLASWLTHAATSRSATAISRWPRRSTTP